MHLNLLFPNILHSYRVCRFYQVQGLTEHFQDTCGGVIGWLSSVTFYTAFIEGWALYAENPLIAYDTDTYKDEPLYKYGMLKSQVQLTIHSCKSSQTDHTSSSYLDLTRGTAGRRALVKLRISNHKLMIEIGRYNQTTKDNRHCPIRGCNVIEDEVHFLFQCPTYSMIRNKFYYKVKTLIPPMYL